MTSLTLERASSTPPPSLDADLTAVNEGPWAGWARFIPIPFDDHAGPYYVRYEGEQVICGFRPEAKNLNVFGIVHGGSLMSFADYALTMIGRGLQEGYRSLTVTFSSEFLGPAAADALLTARGEVTGGGKSLRFVRGMIYSGETPVLAFSATLKAALPPPR